MGLPHTRPVGMGRTCVATPATKQLLYIAAQRMATSKSSRLAHHKQGCTVSSPPDGCIPASLGPPRKDGRCHAYFRLLARPVEPPHFGTSFSEYVATQPQQILSTLEHCNLTDSATCLVADRIYSRTSLEAGTNGGLLASIGTFGLAWSNSCSQSILATGSGKVRIMRHHMASLTYLRLVCEYFHIVPKREKFPCILHCDSKAALHRVKNLPFSTFGTTWQCRGDYDIKASISHCLLHSPFSVTWKWVKDHASWLKQPHKLTWPKTLNEAADNLATLARIDEPWPEQHICISTISTCLRGNLAGKIRFSCTSPDILSYLKDRYNWSDTTIQSRD